MRSAPSPSIRARILLSSTTMIFSVLFFLFASAFAQETGTSLKNGVDSSGFQSLVSLDEGPGEVLLFLEDGRVGRMSPHSRLRNKIKSALKSEIRIEVRLDEKGRVREIRTAVKEHSHAPTSPQSSSPALEPPSVLTPDEALEVFLSMNPNYRNRSQCYNRAHVWTYEALRFKQIRLKKVFMFFTAKYIRDYHYRWWFHVSPFTHVNDRGRIRESILDFTFMNGPVDPKTWSDRFIQAKTPCPTVEKYSDYSEHQYDHYCYFMKVPMYFWQPRHLEALESGSPAPDRFIEEEVGIAYSQGFFRRPVSWTEPLHGQFGISIREIR